MPKAWPGSITSSACPGSAVAFTKEGRTRSRRETTTASRPAFQASDQSVSGSVSGAPTSTSPPQRSSRACRTASILAALE